MAWVYNEGAACFSGTDNAAIVQTGVQTIGNLYLVEITISNLTQGKVVIDSFEDQPEFDENGTFTAFGVASQTAFQMTAKTKDGLMFNGCVESVSLSSIPLITIKDLDGNTVFEQTDDSIVSGSEGNIQYNIDWTDLDEGCYKIYFTDLGIDYESDCISLALSHSCTLLLSWTNDDNAYSFNYSDLTFTPKLRVKGKLWMASYPKEKDVFKDNAGNRYIIKSETSIEEILTLNEVPRYIHDALAIGLENDDFYIDGVKYTNEETEYTPKWRKSSQLAPVEVTVIKDRLLKNNNC